MLQVFVITEDGTLAESIKDYFRFTGTTPVHAYPLKRARAVEPEQVPSLFRQIADWLEGAAAQGGEFALQEAVAVISLSDTEAASFDALNPAVVKEGRWAAVVAMLVLAFPEVHWVFDTHYRPLDTPLFKKLHLLDHGGKLAELMTLRDAGFTPLFDPAGLRAAIRARLRATPESNYVPVRAHGAAAVDEEVAYAYFNAYIAYRLGFRTHVITSYRMMEEVLKDDGGGGDGDERGDGASAPRGISLVFEDLYLNFPDKPYKEHLSNLSARDSFAGLTSADYRVLVTVGHKRTTDFDVGSKNEEYLAHWRRQGRRAKTLYKPLSGIFDVWRRSGLKDWLRGSGGLAPGFEWPPPLALAAAPAGTHSAPGRLLEVAERLLRRARGVAQSANTVPDSVYGAALALEAQEYLGHRTPTSSLEALALKHTLEVSAECLFYGVEYNKDVRSRFREIERDVDSVSRWLRPKTRRLSALDAEVGIVSDLVIRFREHYQFDEEQACLIKLRRLHRRLWFHKNKSWAWLFYPTRWYVETLLSSILIFSLAILLWVVGLSFAFSQSCVACHQMILKDRREQFLENRSAAARRAANAPAGDAAAGRGAAGARQPRPTPQAAALTTPGGAEEAGVVDDKEMELYLKNQEVELHGLGVEHGLAHGATTFFGIQTAHSSETVEAHEPLVLALNVLAIFAGFVHLGIFVSHLYSLVARR